VLDIVFLRFKMVYLFLGSSQIDLCGSMLFVSKGYWVVKNVALKV